MKTKEERKEVLKDGEEQEGRSQTLLNRDKKGRFGIGHKKIGGKRSIPKELKGKILESLSPYLENIGVIIGRIDEPYKQAQAIASFMPYLIPKLSNVEVDDTSNRNLSAEERLSELNDKIDSSLKKQKEMLKKLAVEGGNL